MDSDFRQNDYVIPNRYLIVQNHNVISNPLIKEDLYFNSDDIILNFCKVGKLYKSRRNLLTLQKFLNFCKV